MTRENKIINLPIAIQISECQIPDCNGIYKYQAEGGSYYYGLAEEIFFRCGKSVNDYTFTLEYGGNELLTIEYDENFSDDSRQVEIKFERLTEPKIEFNFTLVPKFFGDYGSDNKKKRFMLYRELLQTERLYINDLYLLRTLKGENESLLSRELYQSIFPEVDNLINLHEDFYKICMESIRIGNKLTETIPIHFMDKEQDFDIYVEYCSTHNSISNTIMRLTKENNTELRDFLNSIKTHQQTRGLDYDSIIIKPVQRICKYHLFFREIIKSLDGGRDCSVTDCVDIVTDAESVAIDVTDRVNEEIRKNDYYTELVEFCTNKNNLPPKFQIFGRKFIEEKEIRYIVEQQKLDGVLFLFNDIILLSQPKKKVLFSSKITYSIFGHYLIKDLQMKLFNDTVQGQLKPSYIGIFNDINVDTLPNISIYFKDSDTCQHISDEITRLKTITSDTSRRRGNSSRSLRFIKDIPEELIEKEEETGQGSIELDKQRKKLRKEQCEKIIEFEKKYCNDIKKIYEETYPLLKEKSGQQFSLDEIETLFFHIKDCVDVSNSIVQELNDNFQSLSNKYTENIPKIYLQHINQLSIYKTNINRTSNIDNLFTSLLKRRQFQVLIDDNTSHFIDIFKTTSSYISELSYFIFQLITFLNRNHLGYNDLIMLYNKLSIYGGGLNTRDSITHSSAINNAPVEHNNIEDDFFY